MPTRSTHSVAVAVVRQGERILMVHERKHGQTWSLPMGRLEATETFHEAAVRETLEEAGVAIVLDGFVRVEHTPLPDSTRMRVIFVAHADGAAVPKQTPDEESLGAAWLTLDEIEALSLRAPNQLTLIRWVMAGATVYPLPFGFDPQEQIKELDGSFTVSTGNAIDLSSGGTFTTSPSANDSLIVPGAAAFMGSVSAFDFSKRESPQEPSTAIS